MKTTQHYAEFKERSPEIWDINLNQHESRTGGHPQMKQKERTVLVLLLPNQTSGQVPVECRATQHWSCLSGASERHSPKHSEIVLANIITKLIETYVGYLTYIESSRQGPVSKIRVTVGNSRPLVRSRWAGTGTSWDNKPQRLHTKSFMLKSPDIIIIICVIIYIFLNIQMIIEPSFSHPLHRPTL